MAISGDAPQDCAIYVALLRGVNVGGHNQVRMEQLRELFTRFGASHVTTHLNSGNVIFCGPPTLAVPSFIEAQLAARLGLSVPVMVRSQQELNGLIDRNPFRESRPSEPKTLYVTFLAKAPDLERLCALPLTPGEAAHLSIRGREMFLRCPEGYGRSRLTNTFLEHHLQLRATTRHWPMVLKLQAAMMALN